MAQQTGLYLDGQWRDATDRLTVHDKYTLEPIRDLAVADEQVVEVAVDGAYRAAARPLPPAERQRILLAAAALLRERTEQIVDDYVSETGFTVTDARGELGRSIALFELCAGEAVRIAGEEVPLSATPGSENRLAFTIRVPVGVVAAIAPFNAPLNTVAHKIGPAIAAGNAVVLKPAEQTPLSAINLVQAFHDAGLPPGYLQLVLGPGERTGAALVRDRRVRYVTFTGSTAVGIAIKESSHLARTHLELGSNSASIVDADADLEKVVQLVTRAGFRKAGQVCTSVQRLLVHRTVANDLGDRLGAVVAGLRAGDPRDTGSDIGPMISAADASRARDWVAAATGSGTRVVGGAADGPLMQPTVVLDPEPGSTLLHEEAFAPVVTVVPVDSFDAAIDLVNSGPYGLQTGVFTQDVDRAFDAARRLQVGGVIINDTSSYHADAMPYGGVKASGHGVEGPRYATHDMTDPRIIVLNLSDPGIPS